MARVYDERLREEINLDRAAHGKKPLREGAAPPTEKTVTVSTTDPDCGLFHKGEHKVEFAYTAHVACDENNFVLACEVTPENVHDSMVFDAVYEDVIASFDEVETVAVDAGYKTPWICKKVQDDSSDCLRLIRRANRERDFLTWAMFACESSADVPPLSTDNAFSAAPSPAPFPAHCITTYAHPTTITKNNPTAFG